MKLGLVFKVLVVAVLVIPASALAVAHAPRSSTLNALVPDSGIGAIQLGESIGAVTRALGAGREVSGCRCFRKYKSGRLWLTVTFDRKQRVSQIATDSSAVTLYGRRLTAGYDSFRRHLKGWHALRCGSVRILKHTTRTAAGRQSTVVEWNPKLLDVDVSRGLGPGGCGTGSP